jgi:N-acetylglucosaminyldiphosphoundecaprenol N-acetyl-beta-D-mannosaminyltransferase
MFGMKAGSIGAPGAEGSGDVPDYGTKAAERAVCPRVNILGVGLSAVNRPRALELVLEAIREKQRGYITFTTMHGVMEAQRDEALRCAYNNAFLCTPDGMSVVWPGKWYGFRQMGRVYGPDLMLDVCAASSKLGIRHFLYGGSNGLAAELQKILSARFPGLQVVGTYEPPFRPLNLEEEAALQKQISETKPDIMWIGVGTPKQDRFMAGHINKLDVTLMAGVGAAFDFHTGRIKQAPPWVQRSGLQWFYRLCQEPRRLWRRFLLLNASYVFLFLCQMLHLRRPKPLE